MEVKDLLIEFKTIENSLATLKWWRGGWLLSFAHQFDVPFVVWLFYVRFPKIQTVSGQLTWSHYIELLKCDDPLEMQFYMKECINEVWKYGSMEKWNEKNCLFILCCVFFTLPLYSETCITMEKTGEVVNDVITETEEHITEEAINNSSAKIYPKGSLIIAMYGQGDTRGRTAKLGIDAATNQACAVLYNIDTNIVNEDYFWYYLQGRYHDLRSFASGNNQPNLNAGKIKEYDVVVPPKEVQNEISVRIKEMKALMKKLKQQAKFVRKRALMDFEKALFQDSIMNHKGQDN